MLTDNTETDESGSSDEDLKRSVTLRSSNKNQSFSSVTKDSDEIEERTSSDNDNSIKLVRKNRVRQIIESDSEFESLSVSAKSTIISSPSPELKTYSQESIKKINTSETSIKNKVHQIIESDSESESLSISSKSIIEGSPSPELKTISHKSILQAKLKTDIVGGIQTQQLLAEQKRLELLKSKTKEEIIKTKTTLRTVNLSLLPDKGKRLQVALARQEASLHDFLIQEKIVNEKLQEVPNNEAETSYFGWRSQRTESETSESGGSDEDTERSTTPRNSNKKQSFPIVIEDSDEIKERTSSDDDNSFKLVQKNRNRQIIESDSESESLSTATKSIIIGSISPVLKTDSQKSIEKSNTSQTSITHKNKVYQIIESDSESESWPLSGKSLVKGSKSPELKTGSRKSVKTEVHEIIEIDSEPESLSTSAKFTVEGLPSPELKTDSQNSIVQAKLKTDIGDRIRTQQLMAEQKRLEFEKSKIKEEITKTKTTLRTVNSSVLPDKGMRLQVTLARQEARLRDLLIQEKIVNEQLQEVPNALLLQLHLNQDKPSQCRQPPLFQQPLHQPQFSNLAAMGKKALETHRTQQAVTMDALMRLHNSLKSCPSEEVQVADPKGLTVNLMQHQKHALAWLLWREKEKPSGGILADDMGLGKTLTMISLVLKSKEEKMPNSDTEEKASTDDCNSDEEEENKTKSNWLSSASGKKYKGKTLVICPATLIGQWENEINKRVQSSLLSVEMYHGPNRLKKESRLCRRDIVITTYSIVSRENGVPKQKNSDNREIGGAKRKNNDNSQGSLFNIRWERIILDEAHQIRNHKSQTAMAVCNLKAKYRWALTGTPIHNKELDLYSLLKFIRCSPFDDLILWKRWVDNRDAAGNQRLGTIIKALMLRRTKEDLQSKGSLSSLPSKKFSSVEVRLTKDEFELYQKILDFSKTLLAQYIEQKAEKQDYFGHMPVKNKKTHYKYDMTEDAFAGHPDLAKLHKRMINMADVKTTDILVLLLRLRQICCHPCLIKAMLNKEDVVNVGIEDDEGLDLGLLEKMGDMTLIEDDDRNIENQNGASKEFGPLNQNNPIFDSNKLSSKIEAVVKILEDHILGTEDKAVIVSQWASFLDLIYNVLKLKNIKSVLLTGSVPVKVRGGIVQEFNQKNRGPKVMLLSLTAGGVGLNLVGANHLLMIDLHWNPQLEAQACDRIYRVGQTKEVHIYKFICVETIEERIQKLQEMKLALAHNVLTGTNITQASKLSLNDLKMLFNMNNV